MPTSGVSKNETYRNILTESSYKKRLFYGVCPVCGDWRIIKVRGGYLKEDPKTGEQKWVSQGFYHTCGSVENDSYDVQKMHYVLKASHRKSPPCEYLGE